MGIEERKQREREQRCNTIIKAALTVFLKKDVSGTTMEEIAEKAELSKATLYLYFKNKEEIFLNVLILVYKKYAELLEAEANIEITSLERVRSMGRAYLKFYREHYNYYRLMNNFNSQIDIDLSAYEVSQEMSKAKNRIWEIVCAPITAGIAEGIFKADTVPLEVGITLWTASTGVINLWDHIQHSAQSVQKPAEKSMESSYGHMINVNFERILLNLWDAVFHNILVDKTLSN